MLDRRDAGLDVRELLLELRDCTCEPRARLVIRLHTGGSRLDAFESLAQGIPTVAALSPTELAAWTELAGGRPPPIVAPARLEEAMRATLFAGDAQPILRAWASAVLDPQRWLDACAAWYAPRSCLRAA